MSEFSIMPQHTALGAFHDSIYRSEDEQMHLNMRYQQGQFFDENRHALPPTPPHHLEDHGRPQVYSDIAQVLHPQYMSYHQMGQPGFSSPAMNIPEHIHGFLANHGPMSDQMSAQIQQTEEADPQARPRMTAEQTRELENAYLLNSKPSTQQKLEFAKRLGLTKAKVDNWFQNRRAKTKQQNKAGKSVEVKTIVGLPLHQSEQFNQVVLPQSSMGLDLPIQSSFHHPRSLFETDASELSEHQEWATSPESTGNDVEQESERSPIETAPLDPDRFGHLHHLQRQFGFSRPNPAFGNVSINGSWSPETHLVNAVGSYDGNLLLTRESPFVMHNESITEISNMMRQESNNRALEISQSAHSHLSPSSEVQSVDASFFSLQNSPQGVSFNNTSIHQLPMEAFSRRESIVSELAADVDGMGFPSQPSQDDQSRFSSPTMSHEDSIAARRKQRPAALHPMRTVSATAALASPTRGELVPLQLRRIKSTGNSLNIATGRIQKSGTSSAQRSPLRASFLQGGLDQSEFQSQGHQIHTENQTQAISPSIEVHGDEGHYSRNLEIDNVLCGNSPSNWTAPPLSATLTGDESSPPITPLTNQTFMGNWQELNIPQSAPAHVATFPDQSPPMGAYEHHGGPCYVAPQPQYPFNSFVNPGQAPQVQSMFPPMPSVVYDMGHQPHISRPASLGAQITFPAAPPQTDPLKIEFSVQTLDDHHHMLPQRGNCYSFQNSCAKDFQSKGNGSAAASPTSRP